MIFCIPCQVKTHGGTVSFLVSGRGVGYLLRADESMEQEDTP